MDDETIRKNILDLHFQKHLATRTTSIIISFTYLLGIGIAVLTEQIRLNDFIMMGVVAMVSSVVLGICVAFIFNSGFHIKEIPENLKNLGIKPFSANI